MSVSSVLYFAAAAAWGLLIVLAFVGWGGVFLQYAKAGWGLNGVVGVGFALLLGGILNSVSAICGMCLVAFVVLGVLAFLALLVRGKRFRIRRAMVRKHPVWMTVFAWVALLLMLRYLGSVWGTTHGGGFNIHDDFHAYFVFPEKMLQMGSMGEDPFSERRLVTSLGGHAFLQALIGSVFGYQQFLVADAGFGIILLTGVVWHWLIAKGIRCEMAGLGLLVMFFLPYTHAVVNSTSTFLPIPMLISVGILLGAEWVARLSLLHRSFLLALLCAGICSLKSSLIPGCVLLIAVAYLVRFIRLRERRGIVFLEVAVVGSLTFIMLLPWMLSMYASSGTLLYPLLGRGYHGSVYGNACLLPSQGLTFTAQMGLMVESTEAFFSSRGVYVAVFLVSACLALRLWSNPIKLSACFGMVAVGLIGAPVISVLTGGTGNFRYAFPYAFASTLFVIFEGVGMCNGSLSGVRRFPVRLHVGSVLLILGMIAQGSGDKTIAMYRTMARNALAGLRGRSIVDESEVKRYRRMQEVLPRGSTMLCRLDKPFLLDFARNKVLIADYPGSASPPPGMPFKRGAEALARYLHSKGIRYVAYSYGNEASFQKAVYGHRLSPEVHPWIRTEAALTFDFHQSLMQLARTRRVLYDDGHGLLFDLTNGIDDED